MVALLLATLFQTAAPAAAAAAAPAAPPAKAVRLCRTETVVGSTIKKRICRPKPAQEIAQADKTDATQLAETSPK